MTFVDDRSDPITPVDIGHHVEDIWTDERGGELEQSYNFIDYHFERDAAYMRARTYLDEASSVTLFGPFGSRGSLDECPAPDLERDVKAYLRRRFRYMKRP